MFSLLLIMLNPFAMWLAFPAPDYYGFSAPPRPDRPAMDPPCPVAAGCDTGSGMTGMVPTFAFEPFDGIGTQLCPCTIATATPQAFTVAS